MKDEQVWGLEISISGEQVLLLSSKHIHVILCVRKCLGNLKLSKEIRRYFVTSKCMVGLIPTAQREKHQPLRP